MSVGYWPPTFLAFRTLPMSLFWTCVCLFCVLPIGLASGKGFDGGSVEIENLLKMEDGNNTIFRFSNCQPFLTRFRTFYLVPARHYICAGREAPEVQYKLKCSNDVMKVDLVRTNDIKQIYLDQLKNYPDKECHPQIEDNKATFYLSMTDIYRCGVTRISDKLRNKTMYYHRIIVEHVGNGQPEKESILVKCVVVENKQNRALNKRNVLPAGFQEPEDLEITTSLTEKAPEPMLNMGVRQGKERITGEVNVTPGTPLTMEIYLDKFSAPVYGILVSYMQVTDTKQQEETIIFNGCSVDPYLFENFNTVDGDFLSAKFRAFKFPDSTYVQFRGTVNVCLDKCQGVQCSNGQIGYGRRRRSVESMPADPNKLYEVSLTTFIKINFIENVTQELKSEEVITQTEVKNSTNDLYILKDYKRKESGLIMMNKDKSKGSEVASSKVKNSNVKDYLEGHNEEFKYSVIAEEAANLANLTFHSSNALLILIILLNCF